MSNKQLWVPYCLGSMLESTYLSYPDVQSPVNHPNFGPYDVSRWVLNDPFRATMTYQSWAQGRSAVTVTLTDDAMNTYPMRARYFFDMIHIMNNGSISGWWKANKRGAYYSLVLIDDRKIPDNK